MSWWLIIKFCPKINTFGWLGSVCWVNTQEPCKEALLKVRLFDIQWCVGGIAVQVSLQFFQEEKKVKSKQKQPEKLRGGFEENSIQVR